MSKMCICKNCGKEIAANAKICLHCGVPNKKPIYKKWWFWAIIAVVLISFAGGGAETALPNPGNSIDQTSGSIDNNTASTTTVPVDSSNQTSGNDENSTTAPPSVKTSYSVGDTLQDGSMKIVYAASGEYHEENIFSQPNDGNKYIYLKFYFENTSSKADDSVSIYNFECYADGYAADMYYSGEDTLSATLSAGRITTGYVYFEIPQNAKNVEIEYTTNYFTADKITFVYEGEKDSGYTPEVNVSPSADAHKVGETITSSRLVITYISCNEYTSDNMFVTPKEGYRFVSCEFEFENVGKADEFVSSFDFDCFADGFSCNSTHIREDDLSATLSSGRKTKGTVTFEVPVNATVIEVEFLSNYWTSNRVVFTVE